ncbi:hypothetical protein SFRURICE_020915 [Spodoptera frugiperda]|nr:hypothetical protein SFRURICE_020915 [Spodoptera frugiperda]
MVIEHRILSLLRLTIASIHHKKTNTFYTGTADVGWQSLLQSTARQGDDVVYMEFRIFSGVSININVLHLGSDVFNINLMLKTRQLACYSGPSQPHSGVSSVVKSVVNVLRDLTAKESRGGILEKVAELYRLYRKPHRPTSDTQDEGTADVGWQSLLQSTARQGDDVVYMEFRIFSGVSPPRIFYLFAEFFSVCLHSRSSARHFLFHNNINIFISHTLCLYCLILIYISSILRWQSMQHIISSIAKFSKCWHVHVLRDSTAKESRGGILEKVAELYRLYRKPHRPTSDTQDEGTADVGWQSLLQSTARQGDDVVYMEFRIFSGVSPTRVTCERVWGKPISDVFRHAVALRQRYLALLSILGYRLTEVLRDLTAKESRGGILEKVAELYRLYRKPHRPTSDTQDEGTADVGWQSLLQSTARQGDDVVYMEFRIFSGVSPPRVTRERVQVQVSFNQHRLTEVLRDLTAKESRGGILEKVAELYRLYRKPHRPTSDTQDEGTADVGWQSLLQSTARQGDDVVYMEFRIFSGVSPPRECKVVCEYSPHLPSTIPSLNVDREGARPALVLACPAGEYSAHLSPSTQVQISFDRRLLVVHLPPTPAVQNTSWCLQHCEPCAMQSPCYSAPTAPDLISAVAACYLTTRPTAQTVVKTVAMVITEKFTQVRKTLTTSSTKESRGGILEKVAELYRLYRKPHRPTSDTQDEGTADVGWQSLLQSTARQGDDVVYMEFRIFSGVSPPRECKVVCKYSLHLPSIIPSLNVDREGARPALVLACPAGEYSAHLSPSTQVCPRCLFLLLLPFRTPLGVFSIVSPKESRGRILEKVAELYRLYRKPHRPTSDTQDEGTADVGWQSLLQSTARQGDDVVYMEFRIFSAFLVKGKPRCYGTRQLKESRGGTLEKVAELYRLYRKPHRPTSDTQDEGTADVGWQSLLQSTARQGDDGVYMEFRIFSGVSPPRVTRRLPSGAYQGRVHKAVDELEKLSEYSIDSYRKHIRPHRPTSDTQDEGTADVGWQSLLQSTARQGDDVVYMEFRIFSGVSPTRIFYLFAGFFSVCVCTRGAAQDKTLLLRNINIICYTWCKSCGPSISGCLVADDDAKSAERSVVG